MTDILLKVGEVAKQLGIGKHAVRRMVPQVVLGPKTVRYRQSDIDAIISRRLVVNSWEHMDLNGNKMARQNDSHQSLRHKRTYLGT